MITSTLKKLGLRDDEIKTFIALAETGEQTAGTLAKKAGVSRPSVYGFLKKMRELGLVSESQRNGTKTFLAAPEEKLGSRSTTRSRNLKKEKMSFFNSLKILRKAQRPSTPPSRFSRGRRAFSRHLRTCCSIAILKRRHTGPFVR